MPGMEDTEYSRSSSNIEDILRSIASVIASGNAGGVAGYLSVGIIDQRARESLKSIISESITENKNNKNNNYSFDDEKKESEEKVKLLNEENKHNKEKNENIKEYIKDLKDVTNGTALFENFLNKSISRLGAYTQVLEFGIEALKMFIHHQEVWLERWIKLNDVGITLNGSLGSLADRATAVGLRIDTYTNLLKEHSSTVAKLGGLYGSGIDSFTVLINRNKELGYRLGMMPEQVAKITAAYASNSELLFNRNESMASLTTKTQEYIIWLDKLSKATGRSRDQIIEETKARENDLRLKILTKNQNNKTKLDALMQLNPNLTVEDQVAFLSGRMTQNLGMMQMNPLGNIISELQHSKNLNETTEIMSRYSNKAKGLYPNMANEMTSAAQYLPAEYYSGMYGIIENLANFDTRGFNEGGRPTAEGDTNRNLRTIGESINKMYNDVSKAFLVRSETLELISRTIIRYLPMIATTVTLISGYMAFRSLKDFIPNSFIGKSYRSFTSPFKEIFKKVQPRDARGRFLTKRFDIIGQTKKVVGAPFRNLATGTKNTFSAMKTGFSGGSGMVNKLISGAKPLFGNIFKKLIPGIIKFGLKGLNIAGWIMMGVDLLVYAIKNGTKIANVTGKIIGWIGRVIVDMLKGIWNGIVFLCKTWWNNVKMLFTHPIQFFKKMISNAGSLWDSFTKGLDEGYNGTKSSESSQSSSESSSYSSSSMESSYSGDSGGSYENNYGGNNYGSNNYNYNYGGGQSYAASSASQLSSNVSRINTSINSNNEKIVSSINNLVEYIKTIEKHTQKIEEYTIQQFNSSFPGLVMGGLYKLLHFYDENKKEEDRIREKNRERNVKQLLQEDDIDLDYYNRYSKPKDLTQSYIQRGLDEKLLKRLGVDNNVILELSNELYDNIETDADYEESLKILKSIEGVNPQIGRALRRHGIKQSLDAANANNTIIDYDENRKLTFDPEEVFKKHMPYLTELVKKEQDLNDERSNLLNFSNIDTLSINSNTINNLLVNSLMDKNKNLLGLDSSILGNKETNFNESLLSKELNKQMNVYKSYIDNLSLETNLDNIQVDIDKTPILNELEKQLNNNKTVNELKPLSSNQENKSNENKEDDSDNMKEILNKIHKTLDENNNLLNSILASNADIVKYTKNTSNGIVYMVNNPNNSN